LEGVGWGEGNLPRIEPATVRYSFDVMRPAAPR
jgi:hypothetical protein